jgi:hypothetical protein
MAQTDNGTRVDEVYDFLRKLFTPADYIGSGEPQHWNVKTLEHAVTPPIVARLFVCPLMPLVAVTFHRDYWTLLIVVWDKDRQIDQANLIDWKLRHKSKQSESTTVRRFDDRLPVFIR